MGHISTTALAKLLGVPSSLVEAAHRKGYLPEPARVRGRRAYDVAAVIRTAEYLGLIQTCMTPTERGDRPVRNAMRDGVENGPA